MELVVVTLSSGWRLPWLHGRVLPSRVRPCTLRAAASSSHQWPRHGGAGTAASTGRKVCALSIDAPGGRAPATRLADFFDVAAGSGAGGGAAVRARAARAALVHRRRGTRVPPPPRARRRRVAPGGLQGLGNLVFACRRGPSSSSTAAAFNRALGDLTLRDTVRPVLVSCHDLSKEHARRKQPPQLMSPGGGGPPVIVGASAATSVAMDSRDGGDAGTGALEPREPQLER